MGIYIFKNFSKLPSTSFLRDERPAPLCFDDDKSEKQQVVNKGDVAGVGIWWIILSNQLGSLTFFWR